MSQETLSPTTIDHRPSSQNLTPPIHHKNQETTAIPFFTQKEKYKLPYIPVPALFLSLEGKEHEYFFASLLFIAFFIQRKDW